MALDTSPYWPVQLFISQKKQWEVFLKDNSHLSILASIFYCMHNVLMELIYSILGHIVIKPVGYATAVLNFPLKSSRQYGRLPASPRPISLGSDRQSI